MITEKDFMENIINLALKYGANEAEVFASEAKVAMAGITSGELKLPTFLWEKGVGIRVVVDKRIGFSATNRVDKESIEEAIKRAISVAKTSKPLEKWQGLPKSEPYPSVKGIYDAKISDMTGDKLIELTGEMLNGVAETSEKVIPAWGMATVTETKEAIINTNGVYGFKQGTSISFSIGVIARDGNIVTPVHSESEAKRMLEIEPYEVGKKATEKALTSLKTVKVDTREYPIILTPEAFAIISLFTLQQAIDGENIVTGRSPFRDKRGEEIFNENITIVDNGLLDGGLATAPFDDEGVPSQKTVIVRKGVLENFIYDHYRANLAGEKSTGNAIRGGMLFGTTRQKYEQLPMIFPTNFVVEKGDVELENMIQDVNRGVLILDIQGAHAANMETGELSAVATPAWYIEDGEIKGNIPGAMININIYKALKEEDLLLTKETKNVFNVYSPWIKTKATIISK